MMLAALLAMPRLPALAVAGLAVAGALSVVSGALRH